MVLQTNAKKVEIFTLGTKLKQVEELGTETLIHPDMKDHVAWAAANPIREPVPRHPEVYPGLGMTAMLKTYGNPPPFPVSGPSAPISGSRPTGITDNPFPGLSMQLASYNYNRTCAIMAGARAGC